MDEEIMTAANEDIEEDIDSSPAVEETEPEVELETEPEITETQRVSRRIKEASQKSVDDFIRSMGLTNHYDNDRPITTKAEYEAFVAMQRLDEDGQTDPVSAYRNQSLEAEITRLRSNERMRELEADLVRGQTFTKLKDQVVELMDYWHPAGDALQRGCSVQHNFGEQLF